MRERRGSGPHAREACQGEAGTPRDASVDASTSGARRIHKAATRPRAVQGGAMDWWTETLTGLAGRLRWHPRGRHEEGKERWPNGIDGGGASNPRIGGKERERWTPAARGGQGETIQWSGLAGEGTTAAGGGDQSRQHADVRQRRAKARCSAHATRKELRCTRYAGPEVTANARMTA